VAVDGVEAGQLDQLHFLRARNAHRRDHRSQVEVPFSDAVLAVPESQ
jgi:hypothetical protein